MDTDIRILSADLRRTKNEGMSHVRVSKARNLNAAGRDLEDRVILRDDRSQVREKMFDKTLADSFPAIRRRALQTQRAQIHFQSYHHEGGTDTWSTSN